MTRTFLTPPLTQTAAQRLRSTRREWQRHSPRHLLTFYKRMMTLWKNLVYFSGITLSIILLVHHRVTGDIPFFSSDNWLGLLFMFLVAMILIFEPIIFTGIVAKKIARISDLPLFLRGILCGTVVFFVWLALYRIGIKNPGYEFYLIMAGWLFANAAPVLAAGIGNPAEPISDGNAEKPLGVEQES